MESSGHDALRVSNPKGLLTLLTPRQPLLSDDRFRAINAQLEERSQTDLTQ